MRQQIAIQGISDFSKRLRRLDAEAPKLIRVANNEAVTVVIDWAKPRIPRRSGRAAASLKARSTRTSARISMGGSRAPYMPWLDFGGRTGIKRSVVREFLADGRYLYPGLRATRSEVIDVMERGVRDAARHAGLEVD